MLTALIANSVDEVARMIMFATHIAAFVVGAFSLLVVQQLRIDKIEASHKVAVAAMVQQYAQAEKEQREITAKAQSAITTNYEKALNEARTRETLLRVDRDRARSAADSLRLTARAAASRIHLPETSPAAVAEYASTASELLSECSRHYQELAGEADGHAADARALSEAWPKAPE